MWKMRRMGSAKNANTSDIARYAMWGSVLLLAVGSALYWAFWSVSYHWNWSGAWEYRQQFVLGWGMTLVASLAAMILSIAFGIAFMLGRRAHALPVKLFCGGVVEVVRGTPLLVQLLVGYYVVANLFGLDRLLVGIAVLALFEGAYLSEIFRGAVESIGASQREAARAVGFNTWQTYRYVIFPQALRRALPGTTGQLVSLVKDSSLLSVIGIEEVVQKVRSMNSAAYVSLEGYLPLAIAYLAVTLPLSWWARSLERRFAYET